MKTHKRKVHNDTGDDCLANQTNQKSPVSLSPKRDQTTQQQQLQYELMNAIASTEQRQQPPAPTNEELNSNMIGTTNATPATLTNNDQQQQQKDAIHSQLSLQQILSNANQFQQLSAVLQAVRIESIFTSDQVVDFCIF